MGILAELIGSLLSSGGGSPGPTTTFTLSSEPTTTTATQTSSAPSETASVWIMIPIDSVSVDAQTGFTIELQTDLGAANVDAFTMISRQMLVWLALLTESQLAKYKTRTDFIDNIVPDDEIWQSWEGTEGEPSDLPTGPWPTTQASELHTNGTLHKRDSPYIAVPSSPLNLAVISQALNSLAIVPTSEDDLLAGTYNVRSDLGYGTVIYAIDGLVDLKHVASSASTARDCVAVLTSRRNSEHKPQIIRSMFTENRFSWDKRRTSVL